MLENKNKNIPKDFKELLLFLIFKLEEYIRKYLEILYKMKFFKRNNKLFLDFYEKFLQQNIEKLNSYLENNKFLIDPQNFFVYYLKVNNRFWVKVVKYIEYFFENTISDLSQEEKLLIDNFKKFIFTDKELKLDISQKIKYWERVLQFNKVNYYILGNFIAWLWYYCLVTGKDNKFTQIFKLDSFKFTKYNVRELIYFFNLFEYEKKYKKLMLNDKFLKVFVDKKSLSKFDLIRLFKYRNSLKEKEERKFINLALKYQVFKEFYYIELLKDLMQEKKVSVNIENKILKDEFKKVFEKFDYIISQWLRLPSFVNIFYMIAVKSSLVSYFKGYKLWDIALLRFKFLSLWRYSRDPKKFKWILDMWKKWDSFILYIKILIISLLWILFNIWGIFLWFLVVFYKNILDFIDKINFQFNVNEVNFIRDFKLSRWIWWVILIFLISGLIVSSLDLKANILASNKVVNKNAATRTKTYFSWVKLAINVNTPYILLKSEKENLNLKTRDEDINLNSADFWYIQEGMYLWNRINKLLKKYEILGKINFVNDKDRVKFINKIVNDYIVLNRDYLLANSYCKTTNIKLLSRCLRTGTAINLKLLKKLILKSVEN